jgi:hypothetical protein
MIARQQTVTHDYTEPLIMSNCGNIDDLKDNIYRDINMQMNMRNRK